MNTLEESRDAYTLETMTSRTSTCSAASEDSRLLLPELDSKLIAFCESDPRCRAFLEKRWSLPVEPDIRKLDGKQYAGVTLLTGGPPCQPASRAGKQGGCNDDRWLWPEALRVLEEAKPLAVVFENPLGIGDVGLDGILSEMGRIGYEVQCSDIPACAADSPQLRHRYWIVGYCVRGGSETKQESNGKPERSEQQASRRANTNRPSRGLVADSERERRERWASESRKKESGQPVGSTTGLHWQNAIWVPCADGKLRRAPDDSFMLAHGLHGSILGALGNAIVPQVATEILMAVRKVLI